jgi:regulatory protein
MEEICYLKNMKITKLEGQKNRKRFNLEIDGSFYAGIDQSLVSDYDLYVGKDITGKELIEIKNENTFRQGLKKAFSLLETRMNSEIELERKLRRKFDFTATKKVIKRLKELGYINDEVFAENWVKDRGRTRGQFMLRSELRQKGVDNNIIEAAIEGRDLDEVVRNATELVTKKKWDVEDKWKKRKLVTNYLSRRGYNYNVIEKVIKNLE